jgi:hypothetical protein
MSRRTLFALVALWSVSVGCVADLASIPCLARELYCDGRCVDPTRDRAHCGACGRACDGLCRDSACVPCPGGQRACGDACVDLAADDAHCGACDVACPDAVANGAGACRAGACVADCEVGFADCNGSLDDGCEVSIARDPSNCGACGAECPAGTRGMATCAGGMCGAVGCPPGSGFADCNGMAADGCEVNIGADVNSCGMCGTRCLLADATAACALGTCTVDGCNDGFGDCNRVAADGCEVDLRVTVAHCGMCGRACVAGPHSTPNCTARTCGLACEAGWADCNGVAADGCEVNLRTDVNNCGACGARRAEVCDGADNSCNGVIDEGCPTGITNLTTLSFQSTSWGGGGGTAFGLQCPAGQVVTGILGRSGGVLDAVGIVCGTPRLVEDRTVMPFRYRIDVTVGGILGPVGGGGGSAFRYNCPANSVAMRVRGREGFNVDQLRIDCYRWDVENAAGVGWRIVRSGVTGTSGTYGGSGGAAFDYTCPSTGAGQPSAMRRFFGGEGNVVDRIGVSCTWPQLVLR